MIIKKLKLLQNIKCSIAFLQGERYLIVKNSHQKKYLLISNLLTVSKQGSDLIIGLTNYESKKSVKILKEFVKKLEEYSRYGEISSKKKLILDGLGFRMNLIDNNSKVEFKIGYSHLIELAVPSKLSVKINKNVITVEGTNKILAGNYARKIVSLKVPDCYKGKGF
jgi:ribosomal protein L6P/L9E